jgi:hypothetical protein
MSSHTEIRLEAKDGTVLGYLAPSFEWEESWTNDTIDNPLPGEDTQAQVLDLSQWIGEVTVQGQFEDSTNLPPNHRQALQNLGFSLPVSAQEQVDRILEYIVFGGESPINLYILDNEFTANNEAQVDPTNGVYPNVAVSEIRTPEEAGLLRKEFLFRFSVGFVSGD